MKLENAFLALIVLGWGADVQSGDQPASAAPAMNTPPSAQGLAGAIEAGMADVSFEASAALGVETLLPPAQEDAPGISSRAPPATPSVSPVPEPSAITLMLAGVAALGVLLSRRWRRGG